MSNSLIDTTGAYLRTRLITARIVLLWLLLIVTWLLADATLPAPAMLAANALFLFIATVVFRTWDDLADIEHDRLQHPGRVLVASNGRWPLVLAVIAGLLLLAVLLRIHGGGSELFLALITVLALLYHSVPGRRAPRTLRAAIVLAKYPALVLLLASPSLRAGFAGLALFLALAVFEWRDDADLRRASAPQLLLAAVTGLVLVSTFALIAGVRP